MTMRFARRLAPLSATTIGVEMRVANPHTPTCKELIDRIMAEAIIKSRLEGLLAA
jgi:hypothetical protein